MKQSKLIHRNARKRYIDFAEVTGKEGRRAKHSVLPRWKQKNKKNCHVSTFGFSEADVGLDSFVPSFLEMQTSKK